MADNSIMITCVSKNIIGFRECAEIRKNAERLGVRVKLAANHKDANTDSILSMVSLGITQGTFVVVTVEALTAKAHNVFEAMKRTMMVLERVII